MKKSIYFLLLFTTTSLAQNATLVCNGNDVTGVETWIGDGFCDDGAYSWNGYDVYFNCPEFNFDDGDCLSIDNDGDGYDDSVDCDDCDDCEDCEDSEECEE